MMKGRKDERIIKISLSFHHFTFIYNMIVLFELRYREMVMETAMNLDMAHMARYDRNTGNLFPTDLGRIASHFYIGYETILIVNEKMTDVSTLKTILTIIAMSQVSVINAY